MKTPGFMFAGQGVQSVGMGKDLVEVSPAARRLFDAADAILGRSISDLCFHGPLEELTASRNCQPAIFTMSAAALEALRERCDVTPAVCGGLSLGEFAALYAAGVFDFETGLRLVEARGRFMDDACEASDGAMAAVLNADRALIEKVAGECDIDIANENCPGQIVLSGARSGVEAAVRALKEAGVQRVVMLQVAGAYHSRLMAPAAERFREILAGVPLRAPSVPVVQNVTGTVVSDPERIRENLVAQITGTVHWEQCVRTMIEIGVDGLVEFGPGRVLTGLARRIDRRMPVLAVGAAADIERAIEVLTSGEGDAS